MNNKTFAKASVLAVAVSMFSAPAVAEFKLPDFSAATVSGNVSLTSDYRFRGLEQTDGGPAIQGGFDVELGNFYLGTWASNVELDGDGSMEIDYYGGYRFPITGEITADVGAIWYDYPQDSNSNSNYDFAEVYVSVSGYNATVGYGYSGDTAGDAGTAHYVYADYTYAIPNVADLNLHYGHSSVSEKDYFATGEEDYSDFSIGLSRDVAGVNLAVDFVGTTLDSNDGSDDYGQEGVVFTISKSL